MSPALTTSSPRDDRVDANPDLARKKQRLSEDHDDSAAEDTVIVEACEPEDIGVSLENAIEIEDDDHIMAPYSQAFWIREKEASQPLAQISGLLDEVASGKYYLQVDVFLTLADWIYNHCDETRQDPVEEWRQQYADLDSDFFARLGHLACNMLSTGDLFEPADPATSGMKAAVQKFFLGLSELSARIIPLLPEIINSTLSRRDSALAGSTAAQPIELVQFVGVAARSLPKYSALMIGFKQWIHFDVKTVSTTNIRTLSHPSVISALGTIVKLLGGAMRQIKDSWTMLQDTLRIFTDVLPHLECSSFLNGVFEEIMEVVKACILPTVCAKHPGALPRGFHDQLISSGQTCLLHFAKGNSHRVTCQTYLRFVKSDEDAILHNDATDDTVSELLAQVSQQDAGVLGKLLAASWTLQASIAYVQSDIMDIRSLGLAALAKQLKSASDFAKKAGDLDHVYAQHAVRFLRKNEVTKYIFSSDSHASLICESSSVIEFLSATATYTDQETDVIWRACSTSVEADFVKASFEVLACQLSLLDFGHVLYILKKYGTTPIEGFGAAAADFLPQVLQRLEEFQGPSFDHASRLAFAFAVIDVLKHIDASKTTPFSGRLRQNLHIAVRKFASNAFATADRREIYARFLPDIGNHASGSTTAAELLTILLSHRLPQEDAAAILAILPVDTAVEELQYFVSIHRDRSENGFAINSIILRLGYILRLMSLDQETPSDDTVKAIFDAAFGENSLCETARGAAWDKLHAITATKDSPRAAKELWRIYMQRYVPSLTTVLASSRLVQLIISYLMQECATGAMESNYALLLNHPLWEALGRFATTSRDNQVIDSATAGIAHFLFDYPANPSTRVFRESSIKCQEETVRTHIQALQESHGQLFDESATSKKLEVVQTINLLHSLLLRSREFKGYFASANTHDIVVLDSPIEETDRLSFTVQVYAADPQPQALSVYAAKATPVSQLLSYLPSKTGAPLNRVIAAGREITGLTTQTLTEAGVQSSGVIQIRPRYKQDFDFDHLLTSAGPVEKEIVAHFDALESLLDCPGLIAERAANFLQIIPPPGKVRDRVFSSSVFAGELFPKDSLARAQFSIYVLDWHLRDCIRLGVADAHFLTKGAHLLTSVLMDESRDLLEPITPNLLACLHAFLQERPIPDETGPFFIDGAAFAARMMDRLFEIERRSRRDAAMGAVACNAYATLLLATEIDASAWEHFSTADNSTRLHALLLLHPSLGFSEGVARPIRSLCQNSATSKDRPDFFWQSLAGCLTQALSAPPQSTVFFDLASDVLHTTNKIQAEEENARGLVEHLSATLWAYKHTESATTLLRDNAMAGLLTLLKDSITILKSFKKPLQLDGLSSRIAEQLLFATDSNQRIGPVIHDSTRAIAYDLLRLTLESTNDFERIVNATEQITAMSVRQVGAKFPGPEAWRRGPFDCSGLHNLGMTCYMNSMLQQLFGNIQFRRFILDLPVFYPEKQVLLQQVQSLLAKMQNSVEPAQDTTALAQALGVQVGNQEDVHDFYASLLSRLEDEMPETASKIALMKFFTGHSITQIRGECGHVSSQKEAFGDLSVTVKNKPNLHDSLVEFVQGEPMEGSNKYKCMSCDPENGRLVDAMRRTCLEDVPDCLTVCLKRFTFGSKFLGEGKVNDRFDFPELIDMSLYKRSHLESPEQPHEPDFFRLVGVIVHQGSLNLGHYWSYIRVPSPYSPDVGDWFLLEDTKSLHRPAGFETIQQECFGGQRYSNGNERPDNAYVLFYQRTSYITEAPLAREGAASSSYVPVGLPKVPVREPLATEIYGQNNWKQRIAALFDDKFASHVCWLLEQYPQFRESSPASSDSELSPGTSEHSDVGLPHAAEAKIGSLMALYVLRILMSDPDCESKLLQTVSAYQTALSQCARLTQHILDEFATDDFGFESLLIHDNVKVRNAVTELLLGCITALHELDSEAYWLTIKQLLRVHCDLRKKGAVDKNPRSWTEYLAFPSFIARQGVDELKLVLDSGYFQWIIEIVWMPREPQWKQAHATLWNLIHRDGVVDFNPLFNFLYELLRDNVDLSNLDYNAPDAKTRHLTPNGWSLIEIERKALAVYEEYDRQRHWCLVMLASPRCWLPEEWREQGFGKLLGLLVSDKTDPDLGILIRNMLAYRYDKEENDLLPLLHATLHYCANTEDGECKDIVRALGRTLPLWSSEQRCLWFFTEAMDLVPCSVVDSILVWAEEFILCEREYGRHLTAKWFKEDLFEAEPLSKDHAFEASRARVSRILANHLMKTVRAAYDGENAKNFWEAAMDVLQAITAYLTALVEAVNKARDEEVPKEIVIESDESRALLPTLKGLLHELKDWESLEVALPTRTVNIRYSVEVDSDDAVSDEDEEMDEPEEFSVSM